MYNGDWLWSVSMALKAIVSGSPVRVFPGQSQSPFQKSPKGFSETSKYKRCITDKEVIYVRVVKKIK